jgi:sugar phosphate isomerase/epimerase
MYKQKIGISLDHKYSIEICEILKIIKNVGFEAISPAWKSNADLVQILNTANELGLEVQSLHAPFGKAADMWSREADIYTPVKNELLEIIASCADLKIPVMVVHAWIGFDYKFEKESLYYENFDEIVSYAKKKNLQIAFENTEGGEYLGALMEHFENNDTVGFCWDSGHEMCYNYFEDLLAKFGDRLIMTHLNDNLGISRFDGKIFWTDDLHLLPFDGVADWDYNIARLQKSQHMPILNFELSINSKPNRHENDVYMQMTPEQYFTEAYKRACKIAYNYSNCKN